MDTAITVGDVLITLGVVGGIFLVLLIGFAILSAIASGFSR